MILKGQLGAPGPQDYAKDPAQKGPRKSGHRHPFDVKVQRFKRADNEVPGAGTYNRTDTVVVHNPKQPNATFKSGMEKTFDIVLGKDNPGAGEYDTEHYKTIANKEFQGGAANNFVLFTRQNYQMRNPRLIEKPRIAETEERTPANVGPGSYLGKQEKGLNVVKKP